MMLRKERFSELYTAMPYYTIQAFIDQSPGSSVFNLGVHTVLTASVGPNTFFFDVAKTMAETITKGATMFSNE